MNHEHYLRRCFELAQKGLGHTKSNPLVGSVIVYNDQIIGEGYHAKYGSAHAEVNAIESVKDKTLLSDSTLYVNLEPCCHFGKTPPCADLILKHKIPNVVICNHDPFIDVNGGGIARLKQNGVNVISGVLENEGKALNRRFFTFHEKSRPYILLKWAQSNDGFLDKSRKENEKGIHWITDKRTKSLTHKWRGEEMGILVGKNTVAVDNPSLTTRAASGDNPIRIVIDSNLELDLKNDVFNAEAKTIIFNSIKTDSIGHLKFVKMEKSSNNLNFILSYLHSQNILSILVEGGAATLNKFIEAKLWDEARILTGEVIFKAGLKAPQIDGDIVEEYNFFNDCIQIVKPKINV